METLTEEQRQKALFITLIQQYQMQGWVSLGKLKNPVTDKIEKNLEMAKVSIEILDMLKSKTQGNLTDEEIRILDQTIADLKLNYVSESQQSGSDETQSKKK